MDVTALAVSKSGRYIASGQLGTKHAKNSEAPVNRLLIHKFILDNFVGL